MNSNRYQLITPRDLNGYGNFANEIADSSWPEFMLHDPIANTNWQELFDRFEEYQFAILDIETDRMAATGNSLPFYWDKPLEELPEGGWDWVFLEAIEFHKNGIEPNIQSAIQIAIHPDYQGQAMRSIGKSKGFKYLVAPVRPNEKSKYPLTVIDDYIKWTNDDGLPFDAWLRVHVRAGAKIIKPCHEAMTIRGTRAEWEEWTNMKFPQSGKYIIPGALNPIEMNIQKDEGLYVEPNVWLQHTIK